MSRLLISFVIGAVFFVHLSTCSKTVDSEPPPLEGIWETAFTVIYEPCWPIPDAPIQLDTIVHVSTLVLYENRYYIEVKPPIPSTYIYYSRCSGGSSHLSDWTGSFTRHKDTLSLIDDLVPNHVEHYQFGLNGDSLYLNLLPGSIIVGGAEVEVYLPVWGIVWGNPYHYGVTYGRKE